MPRRRSALGKNGENPFQNCDYLGNMLIIQEDNKYGEQPDDNQDGGVVMMDFSPMVDLNVDYPVSIVIVYKNDEGKVKQKKHQLPCLCMAIACCKRSF
jgi:hypothetical protein